MCLRRSPEKYIAGAALDRAALKRREVNTPPLKNVTSTNVISINQWGPGVSTSGNNQLFPLFDLGAACCCLRCSCSRHMDKDWTGAFCLSYTFLV
jgi:hypothetical protein